MKESWQRELHKDYVKQVFLPFMCATNENKANEGQ